MNDDQEKLDAVIARFLAAEDAGSVPDPRQYLEDYPELAKPLQAFFKQHGRLKSSGVAANHEQTFGDYQVQRELGRGGIGIVYHATSERIDKDVAVKVLSIPAALDGRQFIRFKNEVESLQLLDHPHIVKIIDVGRVDKSPYYVMPLFEGGNLDSWIDARKKRCNDGHVEDVCRIAKSLASALNHAHQLGVIHRDVKPSNILLDEAEVPSLADFGLARVPGAGTLTLTGDIVGTLRYASPEQIAGERTNVDERSDIYSLGSTIWEMLSLQPLVAEGDRRETIRAVLNDEPKPLSRAGRRSDGSQVPYDLETIVLTCLAKDPANRYQSAAALEEDLDRFENGQPPLAKRPSTTELTLRWMKRNRRLSTVSIAALCLVTAVSLISTTLVSATKNDLKLALEESQTLQAAASENEARAIESERLAIKLRYAGDMQLANIDLAQSDMAPLRARLLRIAEYDPDRKLRGIEWDYLASQCKTRSKPVAKLPADIYALGFLPSGKLLTGGKSSILRIHDPISGEVERELPTDQTEINTIRVSPNGQLVATGGDDGTTKLWNSSNFELVTTCDGGTDEIIWDAAFSSDGLRIATTADQSFAVFDTSTGEKIDQKHSLNSNWEGDIKHLEGLPNQRFLVAEEQRLTTWEPFEDGYRLVKQAVFDNVTRLPECLDKDVIRNVAFTTHTNVKAIAVRDLDSLQEVYRRPIPESVIDIEVCSKANTVATTTRTGSIAIYEYYPAETAPFTLRMTDTWVEEGAFVNLQKSPDESQLYIAAGKEIRRVVLADIEDASFLPGTRMQSLYSNAALTLRDGKLFAGSDAEPICDEVPDFAAITKDGAKVAVISPDRNLVVFDSTTREVIARHRLPDDKLNHLTWSPDCDTLALTHMAHIDNPNRASVRNGLYLWSLSTGEFHCNHDVAVCEHVFFKGQNYVYHKIGSPHATVARNVKTHEVVWQVDSSRVLSLDVHHSKDIFVVGLDRACQFRNASTSELIHEMPLSESASSFKWSPDGTRIAVTIRGGELLLIDSETYDVVGRVKYPYGAAVSFVDDRTLSFPLWIPHTFRFHRNREERRDYVESINRTPILRFPKTEL